MIAYEVHPLVVRAALGCLYSIAKDIYGGSSCSCATYLAAKMEAHLGVAQVQKAVSNEAKAVQVAAAFQGIDQAASKLAATRDEAAATMDAVAQVPFPSIAAPHAYSQHMHIAPHAYRQHMHVASTCI